MRSPVRVGVTARARTAPRRLDAARDQARDTFARALRRDPAVRTSVLGESFEHLAGSLLVELRDNLFVLQVFAGDHLNVRVYKTTRDLLQKERMVGDVFFQYDCPMSRMGKLRKTALVLLKKMQHVEVYEVMTA